MLENFYRFILFKIQSCVPILHLYYCLDEGDAAMFT